MWGGEGLLGCGVGFGLLHRIPQVRPESEVDIHDDLDEYPRDNGPPGQHNGALFVPADDIYDDGEAPNATETHDHDHEPVYPKEDSGPDTPLYTSAPLQPEHSPLSRQTIPTNSTSKFNQPNDDLSTSDSDNEIAPYRPSPPERVMTPTGTPLRGLGPTWRNHGRVASGVDFNLRTPRAAHISKEEEDDGGDEDTEDGTGTVSGSITSVD